MAGCKKGDWDLFFETLDQVYYNGLIGLDIGGEETQIDDIDQAYQRSAK